MKLKKKFDKTFWVKRAKKKKFNISKFRNHSTLEIFSTWSPYNRGLIYHNFLIFNYLNNFPKDKFIKIFKQCKIKNLGNPPSINFENNNITFDDCWTIEEIQFLKKQKRKFKNIIEIGAGYGRSSHSIINFFNIENYVIIDLKNINLLSKNYLSNNLPISQFKKIKFIDFENFNFDQNYFENILKLINIKKFDLVINIDSFQEMEKPLIKNYLSYFSRISKNFYFKNTVAKYFPKDMIDHKAIKKKPPKNVKNLGFQNKLINIFDNNMVEYCANIASKSYNPDSNLFKVYYKKSQLMQFYVHMFYSLKKN